MWVHMAQNGICVPPPVSHHCAGWARRRPPAPRRPWKHRADPPGRTESPPAARIGGRGIRAGGGGRGRAGPPRRWIRPQTRRRRAQRRHGRRAPPPRRRHRRPPRAGRLRPRRAGRSSPRTPAVGSEGGRAPGGARVVGRPPAAPVRHRPARRRGAGAPRRPRPTRQGVCRRQRRASGGAPDPPRSAGGGGGGGSAGGGRGVEVGARPPASTRSGWQTGQDSPASRISASPPWPNRPCPRPGRGGAGAGGAGPRRAPGAPPPPPPPRKAAQRYT